MLLFRKRPRREDTKGGNSLQVNNIRAEMARYGLTGNDVAKALRLNRGSVSMRLTGKRAWTILEGHALVELFNSLGANITLDDLFRPENTTVESK
jgi:transcriptional regulator with XRE-family HTH domain